MVEEAFSSVLVAGGGGGGSVPGAKTPAPGFALGAISFAVRSISLMRSSSSAVGGSLGIEGLANQPARTVYHTAPAIRSTVMPMPTYNFMPLV